MARVRRRRSGSLAAVLVLLAIVLVAAVWWSRRSHGPQPLATVQEPTSSAALAATADRIDPANEGRLVTIHGTLRAGKPAHDPQLGVTANALELQREVAMEQWVETCVNSKCDYALRWSAQPVESSAFRILAGHENPRRLPFASARFAADDVHLGAFQLDARLAARTIPPVAFPVAEAQLPPNLAATFRVRDGVLYAATDPAHRAAGDLRVSYTIVPAGVARVTGVQRGYRLEAPQPN